ncbi:MAG: hypothetical protein EOO15_20145 [Chitinophagaceae bacterium]|nr:MAG: hypothetical protein EOO15_20145 [Chitinophagaceae bacterium]
MKKILRIAGYTAGTAILLCALLFVVAWKSPKYYKPKHREQHAIVAFRNYTGEHPRPYILSRPQLLLFGGAHTRNPQDSQLVDLRRYWSEFKPTVALVEGRLGFLLPGVMDPVKTLGEGGAVEAMAKKDGLPFYNWDLPKEDLAGALLEKFSPQQIALAQVLTPWFGQQRFGRPSSEADYLAPYFKRAAYVGLEDSLQNIADVDRYWQRFFPGTDWRTVSDEQQLPGYLHDMMCASNDLRNQQLIASIKELTARGERVFVLCGSSHAYCVAPSFP